MESLLELDDSELYGPLGLWLLDASAADIGRFWNGYMEREPSGWWISDLVFANWTLLDPLGAIRAADDKRAGSAWWGWTMNDPDAAVEHMLDLAPDKAHYVMRALGFYHPDEVERVLEEHPELKMSSAVEGMAKDLAREDPRAALELLREHGRHWDTDVLEDWARDDPRAAFEWALEQPGTHWGQRSLERLVSMLGREDPEMLAELAAAQPAGRVRRELDKAVFRNLLNEDPEAALESAREVGAPRIAAERLAAVGWRMLAENPERAFGLFGEMLERCPERDEPPDDDRLSQWSSSSGGGVEGVRELTNGLLEVDPGRLLEFMADLDSGKDAGSDGSGSEYVSGLWMQRDVEAYAGWVNEQADERLRDRGAGMIAGQLARDGRHAEAMAWAESRSLEDGRESSIGSVAQQWIHEEREGVQAWLEGAEISERLRERLTRQLESEQR